MRRAPLRACLLAVLAACASDPPASAPEGFELVYSQDFENAGWCSDFGAGDATAWAPGSVGGNGTAWLRNAKPGDGPFGAPGGYLWLSGPFVEDFVLELDVYLPEDGAAGELAVYFGVESAERFVYASLAPQAGSRAHDVFRVDHRAPLSISRSRTFGVPLERGVWQRVRVGRSTLGGRVLVGFGEGAATALTAGNGALAPGWIGFGARGGAAHFDHLRLWAPQWSMEDLDFLPAPAAGR